MEQQIKTIPTTGHSSELGDLKHSRDFGDKRVYPNIQNLQETQEYWKERRLDPDANERSIAGIELILGRVSFELTMREQEA
jgi:hypothetical protein